MPLYNYTCKTCEVSTVISRSIHDNETLPECAKCLEKMVRQYNSPAVTFKGSGFYTTDKK